MKTLSIGTEITATSGNQIIKGTVTKINRTTCAIKVTGGNTRFPIGSDVKCPFSIITAPFKCGERGVEAGSYGIKELDDMTNKINNIVKPPFTPDKHWAMANANALVMLGGVFNGLSPENLTCDGEASRASVNKRFKELHRQWDAITTLMDGVRIEEDQYYTIMGQFGEDIKAALQTDGENVVKWYHYYKPKTETAGA